MTMCSRTKHSPPPQPLFSLSLHSFPHFFYLYLFINLFSTQWAFPYFFLFISYSLSPLSPLTLSLYLSYLLTLFFPHVYASLSFSQSLYLSSSHSVGLFHVTQGGRYLKLKNDKNYLMGQNCQCQCLILPSRVLRKRWDKIRRKGEKKIQIKFGFIWFFLGSHWIIDD